MDRRLALLVFVIAILALLVVDSRRKPKVSAALWVPFVWLAILASRSPSAWFDPPHGLASSALVEEGSDTDRNLSILLLAITLFILSRRKLDWARLVRDNTWLVAFFVYCGISIVWSDFPAVALKRWFRAVGSVAVILVVLSEPNPIAAIRTIVRRCSYVLIPISILLIKYYREYGVDYDYWTGELYNVGIGVNKNGLGRLCLIAGLFCLSDMLVSWQAKNSRSKYINLLIGAFVMSLTLWLLLLSNSATSATSLFAGSAVILLLGLRVVRTHAKNLGIIAMLSIGAFLALGLSFNLIETAVLGLGKNMTLTSRTPLWSELWNLGTNPVLGVGYDSFWLGERLDRIINQFNVNEAHNGYLEVYLELGVIGLLLLMGFVLSVFRKAKQSLQHESSFDFGRLQVAMVVIFLLYNVTESAYKATTLMFFALLLVGISVPRSLRSPRLQQASRMQAGDARLPRMPVSGETRKGGPA